jgi:hypothetical protein
MSVFDIDFNELVKQLVPVRLRRPKTMRWLRCLMVPIAELHATFASNRRDNLYWARHNTQVVYLQAVLNDTFDPSLRGIYITDGNTTDPVYIFLKPEDHPRQLPLAAEAAIYGNPLWLYTAAECAGSEFCFVVKVPTALTYDLVRLRALTDKYRLPGKGNYSVEAY